MNPQADWASLEEAHHSGGTCRRTVTIVRAEGATLWDSEGQTYIDCSSAQGWAILGHSHPHVTQAIQQQAAILIAHTESSYNDQRALWYEELVAVLHRELGETERGTLTRIHVCNSGTEAIESALKAARYFTKKMDIIAVKGSFHGHTMGPLNATWNAKNNEAFEPTCPGIQHVPYNDIDAMANAITPNTAAVLLEVIQSENGVNLGNHSYLRSVRELCDQHGILVIVDEIQTGLGRTGKWFACQHTYNQTGGAFAPDIIALGKGLGGGIPMGAIAWRESLGTLKSGMHGCTFGGNPLACAASRAVFEVLHEEQLPARSARLGKLMQTTTSSWEIPMIRDIRAQGMLVGIELNKPVAGILKSLEKRGVWVLSAGPTVLRLLPPLTISEKDLRGALDTIAEVLQEETK